MFVDFIFLVLVTPATYLFWIYRRLKWSGIILPRTTTLLKKSGVFPIISHYFEPLFDNRLLLFPLDRDRYLPGIDFNKYKQIDFLNKLCYQKELEDLTLNQDLNTAESFYINNGVFEAGDAEFLYQFLRFLKPHNIIEIGSGNSTKIARLALKKNKNESGDNYRHICIEPYEQPWLDNLNGVNVIRRRVEECKLDWSSMLCAGDLLFIDSSHIIRPQGDVLKEYLEIFPQLQSGVFIHVHDIFTPKDYPKSWLVDDVKFWNEQYLLEALLTNTSRYEIVAALNYLKNNYYSVLCKICPYLMMKHEPSSFYFKVI
ncbi:MAG: class I SAM-dependent methyltransferase [Coxiellaceae bacterium]|jgi:hypothetical protein|nr:class I SAM-dependent methyltransferase [Coxiellaceae bacterium]